jgi:hypothetical protein
MAARSERQGTPGGTALVAVLAIVIGIIGIADGIIMIIFNGDVHGYSSGSAVIFGIVTALVGAIYLWVGRGLLRLDPNALFIGLFVSGIRVVFDVIWLIVYGLDGIGLNTLIALIVNAIVFLALMSGRSAFANR